MSDGYNGWKNRATWNVALVLGNIEDVYRSTCTRFSGQRTISEAEARAWCTNIRHSSRQVRDEWGAIGAGEGIKFDDVCWAQIVDCIKEMT